MPKFFKWLFDPTAIGRKRLLFAVLITAAGALRGADAGLHAACEEGTFKGAPCSFDAGSAADYIDTGVEYAEEKTEDPKVEIVGFLFGLYVCIDGYRKDKRARAKKAAAATVLAIALLPCFGYAQEVTPSPTPLADYVRGSAAATRFVTAGESDRTEMEGQVIAEFRLPAQLVASPSVRFTRTQGTEVFAAFQDINSFRSIETEFTLRRALSKHFDVQGSSGVSWASDKDFDPRDPRVWRLGGGGRFSIEEGSISGNVGHNGSVGGIGVWGTIVVNQSDRFRYFGTYDIPLSAKRFRQSPLRFTWGFQGDAFVKRFRERK